MHCTYVKLGNVTALVCSAKRIERCIGCGAPADRLCDWKMGRDRTCDRPVCAKCSHQPAPDKDLCPAHASAWAAHPKNTQRSGGSL
jgi:hypothetical protein